MRSLLECIQGDLEKAEAGNKAAAQRVRTCTIKFEKAAKSYRKESIKADKSGLMKKVKAASKKKPAAPKKAAAKPAAAKPAAAKKPAAKKAPAKRAPAKKAAAPKKKATAKLPKRNKK